MLISQTHIDSFSGVEFDWFAEDVLGNIAIFSTAGYGEIPLDVMLNDTEHKNVAIGIASPNFGTENVWHDFAQVGLFVFDWKHWSGPYIKMHAPEKDMTTEFQRLVRSIPCLPKLNLSFPDVVQVQIERFTLG